MAEILTTPREREILRHALGLDNAKKPYRNRFLASETTDNWPILQGLVTKGLMERVPGDDSRLTCFSVTTEGHKHVN